MSPTSYQAAPPRVNLVYIRSTAKECQERFNQLRIADCEFRIEKPNRKTAIRNL